jgi:carbon storage regulator
MYAPMVCNSVGRFLKIAEAAEECLRNSPYHELRTILCGCEHGVLFLPGHLSCFYYKQHAQEAVARVEGVTQVVNEIEVGRPSTTTDLMTKEITQFDTGTRKKQPQAEGSSHASVEPESVFVNDNVVVTVLRIRDNKVQLGIEAPTGMPVHRREILEAIENRDVPTKVD